MIGAAGNKGDSVRSDCYVSVELTNGSGIELILQSKVAALYGNSIKKLSLDILNYFEIQHAKVTIEDKGALDFVIAARLETAIKKVQSSDKEYLLPIPSEHFYPAEKDRTRRSRLYIPGNSPKLMINAGLYASDGIILDLEDSVAPDQKEEARYLVRNALRSVNFYGAEKMVRINQIPEGINDLVYAVPHHVNIILIPKCESADDIKQVNKEISRMVKPTTRQILLMPIIESALGVIHADRIASAADNVVALAIGLEDYTADIGVNRSEDGKESLYARNVIVNAAASAGIQAFDSVYSDVSNMDGLKENVKASKALGFVGMGCIHPRQVAIINNGFSPEPAEIEKAQEIVLAYEEARQKGSGVIAIGSKMIDLPVVKRALHTINTAVKSGLLTENWREENNG
jgi:citrate lyase subunit beta / citryl-CoA lyase